jgi:hypothetical protein
MSYSYIAPLTGTVTQASTAGIINIPLPGLTSSADLIKFEIWDETQFGGTSSDTDMLAAWWYKDMLPGYAFVQNRVSGQATDITTNMVKTNGFTLIDPTGAQLQAAITGTTITQANPAVASATQTFSTGDVVRITKSTGMLQIAGFDFTVTSVNGSSFDLTYLDTTGYGAAASAFQVQKLNYGAAYQPRRQNIVNISTATAAGVQGAGTSSILTLAVTHSYTVGQAVRIYVPNNYITGPNPFSVTGPTGQNNGVSQFITATISAINTADASSITNTITVNINSTGSTFAFPTSAVAATGVQVPFVEPVGMAATTTIAGSSVNPANLLDDRTRNVSSLVMSLGSSVYGVASDVIRWIAWRGYPLS